MAKAKDQFRAEDYSYRVQYSADDEAYLGLVDEFPGLSAFANTMEGALKAIRQVVAEGIKLLAEKNEPIPEPLSRREYSGKFVVRIDPALHRRLAAAAARSGRSLNDLIKEKLEA